MTRSFSCKKGMGVKGLYSYLRDYRKPVDKNSLQNIETIGVDGLSILYKYRGDSQRIVKFLNPFLKNQIKIIFVFDGKAPEEKREEVETRRERRLEANVQASSIREFLEKETHDEKTRALLEKKIRELEFGPGWYVTREIRHQCQEVLGKIGVECIKAKGEADDLLIHMWKENTIQSIVSCDMDFLVAGVSKLFIPENSCRAEHIDVEEMLRLEEITFRQFQEAAVLCMNQINSHKAFTWIRYYKSIENLKKKHPELCTLEKEYIERMIEKFNTTKV